MGVLARDFAPFEWLPRIRREREGPPVPPLGHLVQVCVVTRDYQRTMEGLVKAGIGPWRVYTFGPETVTELTFRGKPASHSMKLCLAFSGTMMWEIVQPLTGPSLYEDFLEQHGEGVHHVAVDCNGLPWEARLRDGPVQLVAGQAALRLLRDRGGDHHDHRNLLHSGGLRHARPGGLVPRLAAARLERGTSGPFLGLGPAD